MEQIPCKEYVELIATKNINFSLTPYSIVVSNNGVATTAGWIAGGGLTYGFEVTTGSVSTGDVVYVGGSCMTPPVGSQIRVLNVKYVNGDGGLGNAAASGVFGNGGTNADGVAVFSGLISSIANTTVPKDALFFGLGIGTASVNAGIDGYQLPVNDLYTEESLIALHSLQLTRALMLLLQLLVYLIQQLIYGQPQELFKLYSI
ncbi:MAG: hypothetical protein IPG08_09975 [Sphingobacteriaceae bacterium]|nr:hypothetical protein [Sphingobacteriaceae bacterium]